MKLDALFEVKDNKLYRTGETAPINLSEIKTISAEAPLQNNDSFARLTVKWTSVELEEESYNEEFLAELRNLLKAKEEAGQFIILAPEIDRDFGTEEQREAFINAFNHTARRVKDCTSVAGMEIPDEAAPTGNEDFAKNFMRVLAVKHAQYVYFSRSKALQNTGIAAY